MPEDAGSCARSAYASGLVARLLGRAKEAGRSDDQIAVIRHRLDLYCEQTQAVVAKYAEPFWSRATGLPRKSPPEADFLLLCGQLAQSEKKKSQLGNPNQVPWLGFPSLARHGCRLFLESGYDVFDEKLE